MISKTTGERDARSGASKFSGGVTMFVRAIRSLFLGVQSTWIKCNELALHIHTNPSDMNYFRSEDSDLKEHTTGIRQRPKYADSAVYLAPDYWCVYKLARILKPDPRDVFYDIGSGMGRVLCVMARTKARKCVGIELSEELCQIGRQNALHVRGRRAPIDIICVDAALVL